MNKWPMTAAINISYPQTIDFEPSISTCEIVYNSITYPMKCNVYTSFVILMSGLKIDIPKGANIKINLGKITNPIKIATDYGTLTLLAYTDQTF